jgi:MT-A70.
VIVIDPPWPMKKIERDVAPNQVEFDYPTMSEEELFDLKFHALIIAMFGFGLRISIYQLRLNCLNRGG